jgi:hypothetical protein
MLGHRAERRHRQEQQRSNNHDGAEQQESKGYRVIAKGSQAKRGALLHAEKCRHRDRGHDRQIAAEKDDQTTADVPGNRLRRALVACNSNIGIGTNTL